MCIVSLILYLFLLYRCVWIWLKGEMWCDHRNSNQVFLSGILIFWLSVKDFICLCFCVHACVSVLSQSITLWFFSGGPEWDIPETYWVRQDGPLRFLKHCFAMFYWCSLDDSPWHLLMLSVLSKSLAIIKLLVQGPPDKYLRGPHISVDHSLDSQQARLGCLQSKNFTVQGYQGITLKLNQVISSTKQTHSSKHLSSWLNHTAWHTKNELKVAKSCNL